MQMHETPQSHTFFHKYQSVRPIASLNIFNRLAPRHNPKILPAFPKRAKTPKERKKKKRNERRRGSLMQQRPARISPGRWSALVIVASMRGSLSARSILEGNTEFLLDRLIPLDCTAGQYSLD